MSKTIFFREFIVYKPDNINIEDGIIVDKVINCNDNRFRSFKFDCICDVEFKDIKDKEIIIKEIGVDGSIKKRIKRILAREKNLRFTEIDKYKKNVWEISRILI